MTETPRVLIVEANPVEAGEAERALSSRFRVELVATAREARAASVLGLPDCVLISEQLPECSGLELVKEFAKVGCPVVFIARGDRETAGAEGLMTTTKAALRAGAMDVVSKWELQTGLLRRIVDMAVARNEVVASERRERSGHRPLLAVMDHLPEFVSLTDLRGNLHYLNAAGRELVGWSTDMDLSSQHQLELHPAKEGRRLAQEILPQVRDRGAWSGDLELLDTRNGRAISTEVSIVRGGEQDADPFFLFWARDRRSHQHLVARLQGSQRLEALGRLAASTAHDFNNLLTAIVTFATFARNETSEPRVASELDELLESARQAKDVSVRLLSHSRAKEVLPQPLDLAETLQTASRVLSRVVGEDIRVVTQVAPGTGTFSIDVAAFEQVLSNLATNARDAMPAGGELSLVARRLRVTPTSKEHSRVPPGDYVLVEVRDTGVGIAPAVQKTLFEPFIGTKGSGSGLGLATCAAIVGQAGGRIWASSSPDQGTTIHLLFPRLSESDAPQVSLPELPADGGDETILLVEDSEQVRRPTARILRSYGYRVLEAANGTAALEESARHLGSIALVLLDVVMPGLSGRRLLERLELQRPAARVLFMSGYSLREAAERGLSSPDTPLIKKPFAPEELAREVRTALDKNGLTVRQLLQSRPRLLVVEDDQRLVDALRRVFSSEYELEFARDQPEALQVLSRTSPVDAVLCDYRLPGSLGNELYDEVCAEHPELTDRFVFLSGADESSLVVLESRTHCPVLRKPSSGAQMRSALNSMLGRAN